MALEIRKKAVKNFEHIYNSYKLTFSDLRIAFNGTTQNVLITRENGAFVIKRDGFNVTEISVYDETGAGTEETFVNVTVLANRLIELGYIAFYEDGDIVPSEFISSDASNALVIGTDGLLFVPPPGAATNGLPIGGTTGQILKKQSATDFDADWEDENPEPIPTEEQIKGTAQLELTATGAITATFNTHSMLYINQTGNVTLSVTLPTLAIGEKVTRLIWVKPNGNTLTLPTELTDTMSGEVDVAKTNWIAVTYVRIDGSTIVQFSNCTSL